MPYCGVQTSGLAINQTALSNFIMNKKVTVGFDGIPNVMEYQLDLTIPENHSNSVTEAVTGYMPPDFNKFWTYDPKTKILNLLSNDPGGKQQQYPVILATQDGKYAMGIYSPNLPQGGVGYGSTNFVVNTVNPGNTVEWDCSFRKGAITAGQTLHYKCYPIIGTLADVTTAMDKLYAKYPSSGTSVGSLDNADCNTFQGWACDGSNLKQPLAIDFYSDGFAGQGMFVGETTANAATNMGVAITCGGNANHGFSYPTPASLKDSKPHTIYAYAKNIISPGSNSLMSNKPMVIQCANTLPMGWLDYANTSSIGGWAYDADAGVNPIDVAVYIDGTMVVNNVIANISRPDLATSIPGIQGVNHGFSYNLPTLSAGTHTIDVYAINTPAGNNPELSGSPKTITAVPVNNAQFVSQSVPTAMAAGQNYQVSVTMQNTGNTTWTRTANYKLGSRNPQDNLTWSVGRVLLAPANAIAPGQQKTFNFTVTAPTTTATYNFQWGMLQENVAWFGGLSPNVAVPTQASGSVPLYRLWNGTVGDHFYTTSSAEVNSVENSGYVYEGVAAYVFPTQASGFVPLYRYYNSTVGDHFYIIGSANTNPAPSFFGYVYEGIAAYVSQTPQPSPAVTSALTASGTVGATFSYQITASNSPISFNATNLPAGLSINTATGLISGTPTSAGTTSVTLSATSAGGTGTAALALTIIKLGPAAPVITSTLTASGTVGAAFSYQITASNSPTSYNAMGLPAGLSINTATGLISGTLTSAAATNVTVSAANASSTWTAVLSLTVAAAKAASSAPNALQFGDIFVYPNPAKGGKATFHVETPEVDSLDIRIYDFTGRLVHKVHLTGAPATGINGRLAYEYTWDTSQVASGAYMYAVRASQGGNSIQVLKKFAVIR